MPKSGPASGPAKFGVMPKNLDRILKDINEKLETNGILKDRETLNIWTTLMSYLLQGEYIMALPKRQDLQRHMRNQTIPKVNTFNNIIQRLDEILDVYIPPPDLGHVNVVDTYWDGRIQDSEDEQPTEPVKRSNMKGKQPAKSTKDTGRRRISFDDENDFAPEIVESTMFQSKSVTPETPAVSREEFFLLKANESVLMKTVEDQQTKIKNLQDNVESLETKNVKLQDEIKSLASDQEKKLFVMTKAEKEIKFLRKELQEKEHALGLSLTERNTLLDRLSTVADFRMEYEGPCKDEIDDLNRPSLLSDKYNKLYDNDWLNALQILKVEFSEPERNAIKTLLDILYDSYAFCADATEEHTKSLVENLSNPFGTIPEKPNKEEGKPKLESATRRMLGDLKRSVGKHVVGLVQKEFLPTMRHKKPSAYTDVKIMTLRPYIFRCVELCWFMVLQTPPLTLDDRSRVRVGDDFDRDTYRYYSLTGSTMDYLVWPAVFFSKNGLMLCRGMAQPKPEGVALRIDSRSSVNRAT